MVEEVVYVRYEVTIKSIMDICCYADLQFPSCGTVPWLPLWIRARFVANVTIEETVTASKACNVVEWLRSRLRCYSNPLMYIIFMSTVYSHYIHTISLCHCKCLIRSNKHHFIPFVCQLLIHIIYIILRRISVIVWWVVNETCVE